MTGFLSKKPGETWAFTRNSIRHNGEIVLEAENFVTSILFDREGNLWVATAAEGLYLIKTNPFQTWSREEGLPGKNIYPVFEDREGTIWVGTFGQGIARILNNRVENIPGAEGEVLSFSQTSDGILLAGLYSGGYYAFNASTNQFELQDEPAETKDADIYAIFEQQNGNLWLGTNRGLFSIQNDDWKMYNRDSGFTDATVRYFHDAPDGSLWMATNIAGIARYKNGAFNIYNGENGIGSNLIRSLFIEPGSDP